MEGEYGANNVVLGEAIHAADQVTTAAQGTAVDNTTFRVYGEVHFASLASRFPHTVDSFLSFATSLLTMCSYLEYC